MPSPHARSGARKRKKEGSRGLRKGPLHSRTTFRERKPYDRGARNRWAGPRGGEREVAKTQRRKDAKRLSSAAHGGLSTLVTSATARDAKPPPMLCVLASLRLGGVSGLESAALQTARRSGAPRLTRSSNAQR